MKMNVYSVLDRVAGMYGPLFESVNDGVARRHFRQVIDKIVEYDRDAFELWQVAEWDTEEGSLEGRLKKVDIEMPQESDPQGRLI